MIKRLILCSVLLVNFLNVSHAGEAFIDSETTTFHQLLDNFAKVDKNHLPGTPIKQDMLPEPYDYLLMQPLMTPGIEKYYQRSPIVQTIYAVKDEEKNTYSRIIIMLLDKNQARNNAEVAQEKNEEVVVETAVVTMNFNELPEKVKTGVLTTNVPFGKLLIANKVKIVGRDRAFFSIRCNKPLSALTLCKINSKIYGRVNTIVRADNKKWLARVIEILPGITKEDL